MDRAGVIMITVSPFLEQVGLQKFCFLNLVKAVLMEIAVHPIMKSGVNKNCF